MSISKMNICLVDDDPFFTDFMSRSLMNKKYNVRCFSSGIQILDRLDQEPDLIFIDVQMDNMDGFQTSRILRKKWPGVKIILISSSECLENSLNRESRFHDSFEPKSKDLSRIFEQLNHFRRRKQLRLFFTIIAFLMLVLGFFLLGESADNILYKIKST